MPEVLVQDVWTGDPYVFRFEMEAHIAAKNHAYRMGMPEAYTRANPTTKPITHVVLNHKIVPVRKQI